jgi:hypothetical protein
LLSLILFFLLYQREKHQTPRPCLLGEQHIVPQHVAL